MRRLLELVLRSTPAQVAVTLVLYCFYAAVIGVSMVPTVSLFFWAAGRLFLAGRPGGTAVVLFCLCLGGGVFLFIFCTLMLSSLVIRLVSLRVRPGRHPLASPTALCWMLLNGLHTICFRAFLPLVPASFLSLAYFRLAGCRIGHGVWLTTSFLFDPYLITIGEGTVIGGDAVVTAHLFENGMLTLGRVSIGKDCMIGAQALISPGVTIGDGATIGIRACIREGRRVPAGSRIAATPGFPAERVVDLERRR